MMTVCVSSCNSLIDVLFLAFCPLFVYCTRIRVMPMTTSLAVGNDNALTLSIVWRHEKQHAAGICTSSTEPYFWPALLCCCLLRLVRSPS